MFNSQKSFGDSIVIKPEKCAGCGNCRLSCSLQHYEEFNPSKARINVTEDSGATRIEFTQDCNACFMCVKHCVYGALSLKW